MKAAIFNPYLDTLGGGERYTVGAIQAFRHEGYRVELEWKEQAIIGKLEKRFGVSLENTKVVESVNRGDGYDACFWISDGSIPTLRSRNNILHFQVPFKNVNGRTLMNRMKFFRIKHVVCNSNFTKEVIDNEFGVSTKVVYPPVSVGDFKSKRKQNVVCYVGRFSELAQKKRQDVLIEVFKKFYLNNNNWKLVLAGGTEVGKGKIIESLKKAAEGFPVEVVESPSYSEVKELMGISKMFWSASGFEVDEERNPREVEHFGITVVEAMAAKAVPLISEKGGHREIVKNAESGYLWKTKEELLNLALKLSDDPSLLAEVAKTAHSESKRFSNEEFDKHFTSLIK